jgi:hypothetical protein
MHDPGDEKPAYARQGAGLLDGSVSPASTWYFPPGAPDPHSPQALFLDSRGGMGDWVWEISAD